MVEYIDGSGTQIALVHQYILPNGDFGGSGVGPDPKKLLRDGILYLTDFNE